MLERELCSFVLPALGPGSHYVRYHLASLLPIIPRCSAQTNTPRTMARDDKGWRWRRGVGACCLQVRARLSRLASVPSISVFDVENSEWACFLMLCNFEDGVFEVMHELDSFPASSWFVFVFFFFFFTNSFFSQRFFFFFSLLWKAQVMCLK